MDHKETSNTKKAVTRFLLGLPIGMAIGQVFSIVFSVAYLGLSRYQAVPPQLVSRFGGAEGTAMIVQTLLSAFIGATFAGTSVIFELDRWSLLKQTAVHFCVVTATYFLIAINMRWVPLQAAPIISSVFVFVVIYAGIWLVQYYAWRARVRALNSKLSA